MKNNFQANQPEAREDADLAQLFALSDQPDPAVVSAIHESLADLRVQIRYKVRLTDAADSSLDQSPLVYQMPPEQPDRPNQQRLPKVYRTLVLVATLVVTLVGLSLIIILASKANTEQTGNVSVATSTPNAAITPAPTNSLKFGFEEPTLGDWWLSGNQPQTYQISLDRQIKHSGLASALIEAKLSNVADFGILVKQLDPQSYQGKRVRFSAFVKTQNVNDWAGLYMQIVNVDKKTLSFDSMQNRPIKGTQDWQKYEIVLDVPVQSTSLYFGVILSGNGQVWLDDVQFEVASAGVPTTGIATVTPSANK